MKYEGTRLHGTVEYFLKGNGHIPNEYTFRREIIGEDEEIKFSYDLNKVVNTLKFIIGKEILENDYFIM